MLNSIFSIFILVCASVASSSVIAGADLTLPFSTSPLSYTGPADGVSFGDQIGPTWVASANQEQMCLVDPEHPTVQRHYRATVSPIAASTNYRTTIDGVEYMVFDSGTPGIGWVMGVKDTNANAFTPLISNDLQWFPAPGTESHPPPRWDIGGYAKITLVKISTHLATGITNLAAQNLAQVRCYGQYGELTDSAYIKINSIPIIVNASGCTVESPKDPVLDFGKFTNGQFPSVGSLSAAKDIHVQIKCDAGVNVFASLSDQSNIGNRTTNITLTHDSTGAGLAIQAFYNGGSSPVLLGADDPSKGAANQFHIGNSSSQGQVIQIPLSFKYVRTGDISPGTANGLVGITFSYQ